MKRALVIGCARGVWEEVEKAQALAEFEVIYCVKMAGVEWNQGFFYWVTLHPEFMDLYVKLRGQKGLPQDTYQMVGPLPGETRHIEAAQKMHRIVTYRWPGMTSSGSSGLFAAKVALDDGCDRVVLAGCPMQVAGGHFARHATWPQCDAFINAWHFALPKLKGKVRSLSGWTKQILGEPTLEWLQQCEVAQPA